MLQKSNFTEEHIWKLQKQSRRDPALLERTVYAFGLLEAIAQAGLPFIFKGGTCLMLLLKEPHRLSTDIDIIVEPDTDIDAYIKKAANIFPFIRQEEQKRVKRNNIEKRHFKFTYDSPVNGKEFYILLDVLFEHPQYVRTITKEIRNDLLLVEPEYTMVRIPSIECLLGDKLTAFAPHTTGIPLHMGKNMEVMKQLYDVSTLLDEFQNFADVRDTYRKVALTEIAYRGSCVTVEECLLDTFRASICIASRGKFMEEEYPLYLSGIRDLRGHIYSENYSPEVAVGRAAKAAYMTICLLLDTPYQAVSDFHDFAMEQFSFPELAMVRYLRKAAPEAYAYMIKTDKLLGKVMDNYPDLFASSL